MEGIVKKFNPLEMDERDVLALATGRESLLELMLGEMRSCLEPTYNQHYILYGPRGIGKSFFTRLLKIHHDRSEEFDNSLFIQLPEEQDHINFVSDLMDTISTVLEGGNFADAKPSWAISDAKWYQSRKRLEIALEVILTEKGVAHVFVTQENLQTFIPELDKVESGRLREFLSEFQNISIIGSSLRPDLDNDYSKKLFQVFKKVDIKPWKDDDFIEYYRRKAKQSHETESQLSTLLKSKNKIKAIAKFTGGSPRLAVILSDLILDKNILETSMLLDGIIDDLTIYYQDLTKDIPHKSKMLFDMLIRQGENITQSELAQSFNPPLEQSMIARSFKWLLDNYYIIYTKLSKGNTKHFYVRDRLYVLYYQKRQVFADQQFSLIGIFVDFLTEYYTQKEWKEQLDKLDLKHSYSKPILHCFAQRNGIDYALELESNDLKNLIVKKLKTTLNSDLKLEELFDRVFKLAEEGRFEKAIELCNELIKLYPKDAKIYYNLGVFKHVIGDLDGAILEYERSIELDPKFKPSHINLGVTLNKSGDFRRALRVYEKAVKMNPDFATAYYNLGNTKDRLADFRGAISAYERSIELNPKHASSYLNMGVSKGELGDYNGAIKAYERAIELDPKHAKIYYNLGTAKHSLGDYIAAISSYKEAIDLNPKLEDAYYNFGLALRSVGERDKAIDAFKKVLELKEMEEEAMIQIIATLIIKGNWEEIKIQLGNWKGLASKISILGKAFLALLQENSIHDPLFSLKKVIHIAEDYKYPDSLDLISVIAIGLYLTKEIDLLEKLVDELSAEKDIGPTLIVLLDIMRYLINPSDKKLDKLHPDARTVVLSIEEMEGV